MGLISDMIKGIYKVGKYFSILLYKGIKSLSITLNDVRISYKERLRIDKKSETNRKNHFRNEIY